MITAVFRTKDDEVGLAKALAALVPAATEGIVRDVVVVDAGSSDGTLAVADAAGCTILHEADGDGFRDAVDAARADWLLFLSPAAVLEPQWHGEVLAFIDRAILAGEGRRRGAVFRLGRVESGLRARLAESSAALRSRLLAAPRAEQGLLVSRTLYRALGGHRPVGAFAEADLARRIGRRRLELLRAHALVRASGDRPGPFRRLRNAVTLALFVLHMPPGLIERLSG